MEVRDELKELIEKAKLAAIESGELPKGDYPPVQRLELSPKKEFGDYSSNAAMQWARVAHMAPRKIAEILVEHIDSSLVSKRILQVPVSSISFWQRIQFMRN